MSNREAAFILRIKSKKKNSSAVLWARASPSKLFSIQRNWQLMEVSGRLHGSHQILTIVSIIKHSRHIRCFQMYSIQHLLSKYQMSHFFTLPFRKSVSNTIKAHSHLFFPEVQKQFHTFIMFSSRLKISPHLHQKNNCNTAFAITNYKYSKLHLCIRQFIMMTKSYWKKHIKILMNYFMNKEHIFLFLYSLKHKPDKI